MSKLPNLIIPKPEQYMKVAIDKFSKFNCSRVHGMCNAAVLGTVDGRALICNFKEGNNGDFELSNNFVSRVQKRPGKNSRNENAQFYTQVDAVDIGIYNSDFFVAIGGSDDLGVYNNYKKSKVQTLAPISQLIGATTAVSFSPGSDYVAFAVGTDWLKGIHELEGMKRARIGVTKLSKNDMLTYTTK